MDTIDPSESLERWQIRVPKTGAQGEYRGEECFVMDLPIASGDAIEGSLRCVNRGLRRGRPIIYRGSRELEVDLADKEEATFLAGKAEARDPEELAQVAAVKELRDLRRQLALDVDARRRELDNLEKAIVRAREERDAELGRIRKQIEEADEHGRKLVRDTRAHYATELQEVRESHKRIKEATTAGLGEIGKQIELLTGAQEQVNKIMRGPNTLDVFGHMKDAVSAAAESPIGQLVYTEFAARVAATASRRAKKNDPDMEDFSPEDAMTAYVLKGYAANERRQALIEFRGVSQLDPVRHEAALEGIRYFIGEIDLKTITRFCRATTNITVMRDSP